MTTATTPRETLGFQAEVKQLLHLMIHSLYSNKEIFLRELVSQRLRRAATSCASRRSPTTPLLRGRPGPADPRSTVDKEARTITVADNGIGMSREEVVAQHRHDRASRARASSSTR